MAYTPPLYDAVNFNATKAIIIPPFDAINFNISSVYDIEINIKKSILILGTKPFYFTEAAIIRPSISILQLYATKQLINPIVTIAVPLSVVHPYVKQVYVDNLPDIIIKPSILIPRSNLLMVNGGDISSLPSKISGGIPIGWKKPEFNTKSWVVGWDEMTITDNHIPEVKEDMTLLDNSVEAEWKIMEILDNHLSVNHNNPLYFRDLLTQVLWNSLIITDSHVQIPYDHFTEFNNNIEVKYRIPGPQDKHNKISYGGLKAHTLDFIANWNAPAANDCHKLVPWGPISYFMFCLTKYYPPVDGTVNFGIKPSDFVVIDNVFYVEGLNSDPRCPYDHHTTGPRDPYDPGGIPKPVVYSPIEKESYYMLNTILVRRLPDNLPLEVTSVSMKYDRQSWLWQFSLTIGKDKNEYLELIKPDPGNLNIFTDIAISINGWEWICRVEAWSESIVFGKVGWTVTGRSPSMELGSPQNQKTSHIYDPTGTSPTAGGQIIDEILEGSTLLGIPDTGWTVDWSAYGTGIHTGFDPYSAATWGIQPNTFTWTDKTQIEAVKMLLDSIGAFVMTNANCVDSASKKLIVRPNYDEPPWHWKESSPNMPDIDHIVNVSYASEIGRSYSSLTTYNAVYVMGQSETDAQDTNVAPGIVVVEVYRDGFGPGYRVYASDIVDPNITSWQAALERGRMTICETGEWIKHTLRLFSLATYGATSPLISGLILPGDFIRVNDKGHYWFGIVDSTDISGTLSGGPVVYQSIEVRQYIGN